MWLRGEASAFPVSGYNLVWICLVVTTHNLNTNFVQTHDAMLHRTHDSEVATPGIPPENSKPVQIRLLAAIKISVIVNAR